ncbi:hypothetical protein QJS66_10955 [Kocuria rhizophila]|nr:hypothetical protein QJS66_10955 [Kocuria rhizophila]
MVTFDHREDPAPEEDWLPLRRPAPRPGAGPRGGWDRAVVFAAHPDDETLGAKAGPRTALRGRARKCAWSWRPWGELTRTPPRSRRPQLARLRHEELAAAVLDPYR